MESYTLCVYFVSELRKNITFNIISPYAAPFMSDSVRTFFSLVDFDFSFSSTRTLVVQMVTVLTCFADVRKLGFPVINRCFTSTRTILWSLYFSVFVLLIPFLDLFFHYFVCVFSISFSLPLSFPFLFCVSRISSFGI